MSTKTVIGLVVIIIIAVGGYFLVEKSGSMAPAGAPAATTQSGGAQSLQALVAEGAPVTCTFSTTTAQGQQTGTMYIANGDVAGDFQMTTAQGPMQAHMIVMAGTSYVWTSASNTGFKNTVTPGQSSTAGQQGVDYNAPQNFSCQPWTPDSSKFNLPSNISFTAAASYTPPPQGAGATGAASGSATTGAPKGTAAECAQCASLPSAQKAQCMAALQC